jgi:hypothetical protein
MSGEAGVTFLEVLLAATLALLVMIAAYDFFESTNQSYVRETDLADARNTGRVALDIVATDLREAGYSPLGVPFYAIAQGDAGRLRRLADLDGDATVGVPGETNENLSYVFRETGEAGLFVLLRGTDLNGNWSFAEPGESHSTLARNVVQVDFDEDGTLEPFLVYDWEPPAAGATYEYGARATSRVTITFGIRSANRDWGRREFTVVKFQSDIALRNRF